jgi:hypothetical protein
MSTPITPISSISPIASIARRAWQARSLSLPLLVAGALAAGCGTAVTANGYNGKPSTPASSSASGSGSAAAAGSASPAAPGATPVPTVTGGPVVAGSNCTGWPADAAHGKLTAAFTPVSVERCVTSYQEIAGKGEWQTATLERSTDRLATLAEVLMAPSASRPPDVMCPEFVVLPPQIVLFNAAGQELIPKFPVGVCGAINSQVLGALASMTWQPVSVRLVTKVAPAPKTFPGASLGPGSPKMIQTGVANGTPVH